MRYTQAFKALEQRGLRTCKVMQVLNCITQHEGYENKQREVLTGVGLNNAEADIFLVQYECTVLLVCDGRR